MTRARLAVLLLAALLATGVELDPPAAWGQAPGPVTVRTPGGDVTVLADRLEEVGPDNLLIATGNVEITRGTTRLTADRVEINRDTGDAVAMGHAIFYDGPDQITGARIEYNLRTGTGVVHEGAARAQPYYRIAGERMERLDEGRYRVSRGVFTTCEDDPPAWSVRFGSAHADLEDFLYGTNASFWVKQVPLVPFFPFFAAALRRDRQTGFLFPRAGTSSSKGFFYEQPFFWAISDSQDATLTLDVFEEIGVGGAVEYRYILGERHRGLVDLFYVRETRDQEHGDGHDANRGVFSFKHDWTIDRSLVFKADINHVTDDVVFREFGDSIRQVAAQRVESNVFLTKSWSTASLVTNLFWYQDLTTQRSVELQRLPDIQFQLPRQPVPGAPGFLYEIDSSAVNFVRDVGSEGVRLDLHPRLSRPIPVFGFLTATPFVGGRLTGYSKTVTGSTLNFDQTVVVEQTTEEARLRSLLELGGDLESRASRIYSMGGWAGIDAILHSIEPRVNYTWIDGTHMSQLPQWTPPIDNIPETSLLTYSLVNRLRARTVAPAGTEAARWELARLTLGNTYDFRNTERPFGNVVGDLIIDPNRIVTLRADASVNPYGDGLQAINADVALKWPGRVEDPGAPSPLVAALGTRYSRPDNVNFLQGNLIAQLAPWLAVRGSTNWDLETDTFVENRVAVDLKWQCWAFSVEFVSRVKDPVTNRAEEQLRFTVNLLGMGAPLSTSVGLGGLIGAQPGGAIK
jgi:LPS-assembly protein